MRRSRNGGAAPIKIAIYCLLYLITVTVLGSRLLGRKTIVAHARLVRPYWVTFSVEPSQLERSSYGGSSDGGTKGTRIFSFGDSNAFFPEGDDSDLAVLLQDAISAMPGAPALTVFKWHYKGASTFDYYCMFYGAMKYSPDLILVSLNWLNFQDDYVRFHFHPEMSMFVPLREWVSSGYQKPLSLRSISPVKHFQYKLSRFSLYPMGIRAWGRENMRACLEEFIGSTGAAVQSTRRVDNSFGPKPTGYRWSFPMELTDSNLTLQTLSSLVHVASKREATVLFYIWPLDYEYLEEHGSMDRTALEQSKQVILHTLKKKNVYLADLSFLLEHEYFYDRWGHCTKRGRERIADALAPKILEILRDDPRPHE